MKKPRLLFSIGLLFFIVLYAVTHLTALTRLPVFADESIYIRWAQLILDDWQRYLFFPMNDGKTPLFIWLTTLSLSLFANPLTAGRLVSVAAGLLQVKAAALITRELGGKTLARVTAALMIVLLPFWYFHHRMALMDGLLTLLLSFSWLYALKIVSARKHPWKYMTASGLFFGLALLTKLPALLFVPTLLLAPLLVRPKQMSLAQIASWGAGTLLIGLGVFLSLKLHPAFGQLFHRGNDFLYSVNELIGKGIWPVIFANLRTVFSALNLYLTWPVLVLPLAGLFQERWRRKHLLLILSALSFMAPVIVLGKTLYPRYFLPAALPITLSAALAFSQFFRHTQQLIKKPLPFFLRSAALIFLLTTVLSASLEFLFISWKNPDFLPYTPIDRSQYVREWSSGHGIREATDLLLQTARNHTVAVATEGYFGTLPDAMLMYLHTENVTNIMLEGIGQPVHSIPETFAEKAQHYEYIWLIVNDYREEMGLNAGTTQGKLISWYCRVPGAPCLQVWDITALVHTR